MGNQPETEKTNPSLKCPRVEVMTGNCHDEKVEKRLHGVAINMLDYIRGHICPKMTLEAMMRQTEEK